MGAACGCLEAKSSGGKRSNSAIIKNKGGVMIGGG